MPERPHNQTLRSAHFRVARPTNRLKEVEAFYTKGLGFKVIGQFQDHDGFDGVMLGQMVLPAISSSPRNVVILPVNRHPRSTYSSSTYRMQQNGKQWLNVLNH